MGFWRTFSRSARLRCPRCGVGRMFAGYWKMHPRCEHCGLKYERAPGYFLGSIYFNYGLTALLITAGYFGLYFSGAVAPRTALWTMAAGSVLFPMWFFRYARSLWAGFDQYIDPVSDGEEAPADAEQSGAAQHPARERADK